MWLLFTSEGQKSSYSGKMKTDLGFLFRSCAHAKSLYTNKYIIISNNLQSLELEELDRVTWPVYC